MGRCGFRSRIENRRNFEEKGWASPNISNTAEPQPNRNGILQEAAEATEEIPSPLITRISADWMLRNPRPSAPSAENPWSNWISNQSRLRSLRFLL
jgi:hypothetical protein